MQYVLLKITHGAFIKSTTIYNKKTHVSLSTNREQLRNEQNVNEKLKKPCVRFELSLYLYT